MNKNDKAAVNHGHDTPCFHFYAANDTVLKTLFDSFHSIKQKPQQSNHSNSIGNIVSILDQVEIFHPDLLYENGLAAGVSINQKAFWSVLGICHLDKKTLTFTFENKDSEKVSMTISPNLSLLLCQISDNMEFINHLKPNYVDQRR